ncbi:MAG: aminotransferase class IV [Bacteriovorax sp.]|nr:aminotransferase class IV [Bacteriovorax sp.]
MNKFLININGELFNEENAKISVFDRGFLYGDSVYEATRTFNRKAFRIDHHLDRLFSSAQKIELIPSYSKSEILENINQTIKASAHENILLRIILTRGTNSDLGLDPQLASVNNLIIISKAIAPNPDWWLKDGVSMVFYQKTTNTRGSLPKTGNYQENILAYKNAATKGAYDAIMINTDGHITESTTSNIWIIKDGILLTPPLADGVLNGLTRKTLIELAHREKISFKEQSLTKADFFSASECFITSTTRNLVPVTKVEGNPIGTGLPGQKTIELLKMYLEFVAKT